MDQTLVGVAGISSSETFGDGSTATLIQTVIVGTAGIPSEETFPPRTGVNLDLRTVPYSIWVAY